jgi:hypothetical protein
MGGHKNKTARQDERTPTTRHGAPFTQRLAFWDQRSLPKCSFPKTVTTKSVISVDPLCNIAVYLYQENAVFPIVHGLHPAVTGVNPWKVRKGNQVEPRNIEQDEAF